ncbi:hypothetical protein [Longimicrobium sp.]|uniref:hypothetical protein n=1 Tax=Longimicrobium sp. TaxID=2029185 RepID=UPI003B3AA59A
MTRANPFGWTDHRDVPLEVLRDFALTRVEAGSIKRVAAEMGIGHATLHMFVSRGSTPQPRVRRILALWYLDWVTNAPDYDLARPYASALQVLTDDMPEGQRDETLTVLLDGLAAGYVRGGESPPAWVEVLRTVAHRRMMPIIIS